MLLNKPLITSTQPNKSKPIWIGIRTVLLLYNLADVFGGAGVAPQLQLTIEQQTDRMTQNGPRRNLSAVLYQGHTLNAMYVPQYVNRFIN